MIVDVVLVLQSCCSNGALCWLYCIDVTKVMLLRSFMIFDVVLALQSCRSYGALCLFILY